MARTASPEKVQWEAKKAELEKALPKDLNLKLFTKSYAKGKPVKEKVEEQCKKAGYAEVDAILLTCDGTPGG